MFSHTGRHTSHLDKCSQPTLRFWQGLEDPFSEKRIIWVNQAYSDGKRRYPIIAPIGPFIFCLHSGETEAREGANQISLCNNLRHWINHTNFTETDWYFTSNSHAHFLFCSCPCAGLLISVMEHLISHTGATKRLGGFFFLHLSGKYKNMGKTSRWLKKNMYSLTITAILFMHHTQTGIQNVLLCPHVCFNCVLGSFRRLILVSV